MAAPRRFYDAPYVSGAEDLFGQINALFISDVRAYAGTDGTAACSVGGSSGFTVSFTEGTAEENSANALAEAQLWRDRAENAR
jgi:hypothetical protein